MKRQKVVITKSEEEINIKLSQGWYVVSVTPQFVSFGAGYGFGGFCFVIEKETTEDEKE